jgi:hypothetical protein
MLLWLLACRRQHAALAIKLRLKNTSFSKAQRADEIIIKEYLMKNYQAIQHRPNLL